MKYQFFIFVIIWSQCFLHVWGLVPVLHTCEFWYQFFTCDNLIPFFSQMWGFGTDSSHVWGFGTDSSHLWKFDINPSHGTSSSNVKTYKNVKFEHKLYPPHRLSKLTVRKFHICQKWRSGTNSSHGVNLTKFDRAYILVSLTSNFAVTFSDLLLLKQNSCCATNHKHLNNNRCENL